jgi:hypothetical protein
MARSSYLRLVTFNLCSASFARKALRAEDGSRSGTRRLEFAIYLDGGCWCLELSRQIPGAISGCALN